MIAVPIGIDITGLDAEDQARILAVGLSPWMDELASRPKSNSVRCDARVQVSILKHHRQSRTVCHETRREGTRGACRDV